MEKTWNNKAWFMVLPVLVLVAFSAVIPLMTVVNYSVQDTFGGNQFFWAGTEWFEEMLHSDRFWAAMGRNLVFSAIILVIQIPLGIFIALNMPRKGWGVPVCLVLMALPLLIPWNVVGTIWQVFGRIDIGLLGYTLHALGFDYNYVNDPFDAWVTVIIMDVWHWTSLVVLLCYAGLVSIPDAFYQAAKIDGASLGSVPLHPVAQDAARAFDRRAAALHGLLHDLHRALRRHWRRPRQFDDLPVDRPRQDGCRPVRPRTGCGDVDHLLPDRALAVMGLLHRDDKLRRGEVRWGAQGKLS